MISERSPWRLAAAFAAAIAVLFVAANLVASRMRITGLGLPDYGTWSGVLQVEQKLRLLEDFAKQGPVDALLISSSMGDLGLSAETLTRELTARHGRPYRVFNFSMGGADIPTYPVIYRLARLVAKPREVWLVAPVSGPRPVIVAGSLDEKLFKGPIGGYERVPGLLKVSRELYELPLVRFAPALRDALVYQRFKNRPVTNLDLYEINAWGDTVSWLYNVQQYEHGVKHAIDRRKEMLTFVLQPNESERRKHEAIYFNPRAVAAIAEMRDALRADGVALRIVPFDHAVALGLRDAEYLGASRIYFDKLSREYEAPVVDVRPDFELQPYMISDSTHLNMIGAYEFARVLADRIAGKTSQPPVRFEVSEKIRAQAPDKTWSSFTALIPRRANDPAASLELDFLQSWGLARLRANSDVQVEVRLPDDRDVALPTRVTSPGLVVADTSGLPLAGRDMVLRVQLEAASGNVGDPLAIPLSTYRWSGEKHAASFFARVTQATVESEKAVYGALEPVRVRWSGLDDPARYDWVGVYPAGDQKALRLTFKNTGGTASGTMEMQPLFYAGKYDLRLFRDNNWDLLGVSKPFEVVAVVGKLEVGHSRATAGSQITARWSGLNYPNEKDWIGIFPRLSNKVINSTQAKTGGTAAGETSIRIPEDTPPGDYEVRLYSTGGWTLLADRPLRVEAP